MNTNSLHPWQALQSLLSNPAAMSVESLERAHREESGTPPVGLNAQKGSLDYHTMPPIPLKAMPAADLESDLKNKLHISAGISGGKQKTPNGTKRHNNSGERLNKVGSALNGSKQSYAGATKSPPKRIQQVICF